MRSKILAVMAGLVPAIHVLASGKTWMPGKSPGMTKKRMRVER
jgi:hypothetical protein